MMQKIFFSFLYANSSKNRILYVECMKNITLLCGKEDIKKYVFPYIINLCKDQVTNVVLCTIDSFTIISELLNYKNYFAKENHDYF